MIRHLRGAWARRRVLLPLVLLTATVVAGVVAVVGFAGAAGTSGALALPLLVLGAVAVPATARELATVRRGEIALARLRGLESGELQALLVVEPALALALGGALGVGAGAGGAWLAGRAWIGTDADPLGVDALLAGLAVVVVALGAAAIGSAAVLREPLVQQVSPAERPRRGSVAATFGRVLVVVAAVVAVYRARTATGTDPDWVVLAGPALVGLAAGQVVVGAVQLLARLAVRRPAGRLPVFLAARRVARLPDAARALHVVVGAAVVAGLALTGALQVDGWVDDTTRLQLGAPVQVPVDGATALEVLATTHAIDPDGLWLMGAVLVPSPGGPQARRAFLDTARYDRVVGPFLDGTAASGLADHVAELAADAPRLATGDRVAVTVAGVSARRSGRLLPVVDVGYRDASGAETRVRVRAEIATDGRPVSASAPLPGCAGGCELTDVLLRRGGDSTPLPWLLTGLDLGGVDALGLGWVADGSSVVVDGGLLAPGGRVARARSIGSLGATPVLTTPSVAAADRDRIASTGGDERETRVLDVLDALPLVGSDGMLADLPTAAAGAPPTVPAAEALVLARADTPDDVLAALAGAGGERRRRWPRPRRRRSGRPVRHRPGSTR